MDFASSMSGPHHYLGWLDPTQRLSIRFAPGEALPDVFELGPAAAFLLPPFPLHPVPDRFITQLTGYTWLAGATTDPAVLRTFEGDHEGLYTDRVDTRSGEASAADSLFDTPGILAVPQHELIFPLLTGADAMNLDLSPFHAQVVANEGPFQFDQRLVAARKHAQHKLRVVTYNFGDRYLSDYIMTKSGVFVERHEFIQSITPCNAQCGGFVLLGRESHGTTLHLVAVTIPFGSTLLVGQRVDPRGQHLDGSVHDGNDGQPPRDGHRRHGVHKKQNDTPQRTVYDSAATRACTWPSRFGLYDDVKRQDAGGGGGGRPAAEGAYRRTARSLCGHVLAAGHCHRPAGPWVEENFGDVAAGRGEGRMSKHK